MLYIYLDFSGFENIKYDTGYVNAGLVYGNIKQSMELKSVGDLKRREYGLCEYERIKADFLHEECIASKFYYGHAL